jgi:hypothetical protein
MAKYFRVAYYFNGKALENISLPIPSEEVLDTTPTVNSLEVIVFPFFPLKMLQ